MFSRIAISSKRKSEQLQNKSPEHASVVLAMRLEICSDAAFRVHRLLRRHSSTTGVVTQHVWGRGLSGPARLKIFELPNPRHGDHYQKLQKEDVDLGPQLSEAKRDLRSSDAFEAVKLQLQVATTLHRTLPKHYMHAPRTDCHTVRYSETDPVTFPVLRVGG